MLTTSFSSEITSSEPQAYEGSLLPGSFSQPSLTDGPTQMFDAKEHVFCEGDPAGHIYRIEAGNVCIYKMLPDGRRQVIDFAYPGDLVGLGAADEHQLSAQAMSRTRVRRIPLNALRQAVRDDSRVGLKLLETLSSDLHASQEFVVTLGQRCAHERFAAFLQALSRRNRRSSEDPGEFVLPMTRTDIADFLGLTIETVSRLFTKFRAAGIIEISQCVLIKILDHGKLAGLAEGRISAKL
jgi:CRP/FNR family transcriptional regulator, anaerobic regulatory protein